MIPLSCFLPRLKIMSEKAEKRNEKITVSAANPGTRRNSPSRNIISEKEEKTTASAGTHEANDEKKLEGSSTDSLSSSLVPPPPLLKTNDDKKLQRSSTDSLSSSILPPPPLLGQLDRQTAGHVLPEPGAYAIGRRSLIGSSTAENDSSRNRNRSSNNNLTSSTLDDTTITARGSQEGVQASSSDHDNRHHRSPSRRDGRDLYFRSGQSLIEAELVNSTISAVHVEPVDEEAKRRRRNKRLVWSVAGFVTVIVLAVATTIVVDKKKLQPPSNEDKYGYECLGSTLELLQQQYIDLIASNYTATKDTYVICPNTTINCEDWVPDLYRPVNREGGKDYPIIVLFSGTTVQCGREEFDRENDQYYGPCVLDGGYTQVALRQFDFIQRFSETDFSERDWIETVGAQLGPTISLPQWKGIVWTLATQLTFDNVTIHGFTFTGGISSGYDFLGTSVYISQPGTITLSNCTWESLTAPSGVVRVSEDYTNRNVRNQSTTLTIRNCTFKDSLYAQSIIDVANQTVIVEATNFSSMQAYQKDQRLMCLDPNDKYFECTYLMACRGHASCIIRDSCQNDVDSPSGNADDNDWLYITENATIQIDERSIKCGFNETQIRYAWLGAPFN